VSSDPLPWRQFTYPLNVFMHILTHEEGGVEWLHYGLFEDEHEPLAVAQERSTQLLLSRLPSPPAKLLEAGIGLATTLHRLTKLGYDVEGITPDAQQIAMVRARYGEGVRVQCAAFESFAPATTYDMILFQESAQYIDSEALFARAAMLAPRVLVLDEFALRPLDEPGSLHALPHFLEAAARHGFAVDEEIDLSAKAAPTMAYFTDRIPAYRARLIADLGITEEQVDHLVDNGATYRDRYATGIYGYRLLLLRKETSCASDSPLPSSVSPPLSPPRN
jgi:hypothetical protein